jgi:hypothetical protein
MSREKLKTSQSKRFFFEKKNQKTFSTLGQWRWPPQRPGLSVKSLFASFSSEKEVLIKS